MQFTTWTLGTSAMAAMMAGAWAQQLDYADSLQALSYGNVDMQGNSSGTVWLNVTGFAADKLPYIQNDLGIMSLDNMEPLQILAGLAETAASKGQYGDLVYLYTAFAMNGHADHVKVSSDEMQQGLLMAVTPPNSNTPDQGLIKLYAGTSSSSYISQAFLGLQGQTFNTATNTTTDVSTPTAGTLSNSSLEKRWTKETCSKAHQAAKSACRALISKLSGNVTLKTGGPRAVCYAGCCVSWSANATFQYQNLTNAANYCVNACGSVNVSCEVKGGGWVSLRLRTGPDFVGDELGE
ncbi:MAG: hypothetical protein M1836_000719 [Candelina mexicana]|nr:MAG: hypothetical protein M1836_000719 [Candelina mexicana]